MLQPDLLDLQVTRLLPQEIHLVAVVLLVLSEIFLQVVNVFQDLLQNVVEALCALVLKCSALRSKELGVFFVIV